MRHEASEYDIVNIVYFRIIFPQAPEKNIRVISNFFRKFAEVFVIQGATPVSTTPLAIVQLVTESVITE
jgi:hypothetical protein